MFSLRAFAVVVLLVLFLVPTASGLISHRVGGSHLLATRAVGLRTSKLGACVDASLLTAATDTVNAWSVSGKTLNGEDIASTLFALSLFPYLAFLYFLGQPKSRSPPLVVFGFQFLLFFVGATIPAGIQAKTQYHDILANVDYLHGTAESLLTVTNILIIFGFRRTRSQPFQLNEPPAPRLNDVAIPILLALSGLGLALPQLHPEPINALSIPTWMVHSSSLLEWLVAMKLIWEHAETSGNPRWRGLTWAMLPSHTSGICACTYHFFFNAPILAWIVSLQAGLTVLGNACLAVAAYRISQYSSAPQDGTASSAVVDTGTDQQVVPPPLVLETTDKEFLTGLFVKSLALAVLVKYGSLALDLPFEEDPSFWAAAIILLPTCLVACNWIVVGSQQVQVASFSPVTAEGKKALSSEP